MAELSRRLGGPIAALAVAAVAIWLVLLVALPDLLMIDYSLRPNLPPSEIGGPQDVHSLANYAVLWSNKIHLGIFFRTIWASSLVTVITLVVCYPVAFYLAKVAKPSNAALLVLLLIIPFWINEILRTFAWYIVLAYNGPLNRVLTGLGIMARPIRWYGTAGVMVGMVYAYILFMVFPLTNAMESLDRNQIDAARDLGASRWRIHRRIVIPHAKPGIATGCVMTFMLAAGSYAVPSLLGSPSSRWFTEIIYNWFFEGGNWNLGAAYAFLLLLLCIVFIAVMMRLFRVSLADIAR
ncbi:spermidine/putrescine transport system permease protein [Faunimonas pinastri]|uniref:Spermidine/putrescine transport system permease protein n=1 Tax=Faunimonas pinastri TaxID=1855383 RepID=A0A1H9AAX3_9HYPH|nr:ABC transporter permease [Faunimonas pinastri]SEP73896.1 spermidine/putrescine transport system permease protein [Faunimonas pinastri]